MKNQLMKRRLPLILLMAGFVLCIGLLAAGFSYAEGEETHGEDILFQVKTATVNLEERHGSYSIPYTVVPKEAQDKKVTWSSSDEDIAVVSDTGEVTLKDLGEAVITAKLKYGKTREFPIAVTDEETVPPEFIWPEARMKA